jgi:hypothetical protein
MTRGRRSGRGQSLVEFALVAPLFFTMLFAVIDFGRVIWATNTLSNAAREAARFAVVHGGSPSTTCPVGPRGPQSPPTSPSASCPYPAPSTQAIVDVARAYAVGTGGTITVSVCYGTGCSGNTHTQDTNQRGTPVTVVVAGQIGLFTGALLGLPNFNVQGNSTMLVNH